MHEQTPTSANRIVNHSRIGKSAFRLSLPFTRVTLMPLNNDIKVAAGDSLNISCSQAFRIAESADTFIFSRTAHKTLER